VSSTAAPEDPVLPSALDRIDLAFLAAGQCQHVYVRPQDDADVWVYKLPAESGHVAQFGARLERYKPVTRSKQALRALLVLPDVAYDRMRERYAARRGTRGPGLGSAVLDGSYRIVCAGRNAALGAYYRWTGRRSFDAMLELMTYLSEQGLGNVMLPYVVVPCAAATLLVDGATLPYEGPILIQRRAEFFEREYRFDLFDWRDLVTAQHRLWRRGVALSDRSNILGPKNWALLDGRLYLADTSCLTRDFQRAWRVLSPERLDERQAGIMRKVASGHATREGEEYFRYVRSEISRTKLKQLWRADLGRDRSSGT
jgi:hypothetical protein